MHLPTLASAILATTIVGAYKLSLYEDQDYFGDHDVYASDGNHYPE